MQLVQSTVNIYFNVALCTGDNNDRLHPITVIEKYHLLAGHTFVSKEIAWMRIAEEANHRQMKFITEISNLFNLYVSGVQVNFSKKNTRKVKLAAVRENDIGVNLPIDDWLKSIEGKNT